MRIIGVMKAVEQGDCLDDPLHGLLPERCDAGGYHGKAPYQGFP
jgi:hypothetical protein